jgi:hypothetical protein
MVSHEKIHEQDIIDIRVQQTNIHSEFLIAYIKYI